MAYFPTPYDFGQVMGFLGALIDGTGYFYILTGPAPTDAASYATNVMWEDTKTQPTWAYVAPGGTGFMLYNTWYQANVSPTCGPTDAALATVTALIPAAQVQTNWNSTSGLSSIANKPTLAMVATTGSYNDLSGKPAARSQSIASRTLNSSFQVSSTRDCMASYSVSIAASLSLTTGQSGTASLQISPDNITFTEIARFVNGNTGTLSVGLALVQTVCNNLSGYVPSGYYAKIVTSGTATSTYITGQETLL